jgi:hypothetical protein
MEWSSVGPPATFSRPPPLIPTGQNTTLTIILLLKGYLVRYCEQNFDFDSELFKKYLLKGIVS